MAKALDFLYENNYGFKPLVAEIDNIVTLSHLRSATVSLATYPPYLIM